MIYSLPSAPSAPVATPAAFELRGVGKQRDSAKILCDINLFIPKASMTCLVGPSGAGKTTLLRLLNRMDEPDSGSIFLDNVALTLIPVQQLRRRVGFVFQTPVMFEGSVQDNFQIASNLCGQSIDAKHFASVIESVELPKSALSRVAMTLSGGEKQRVALARALIARPEVLLLDEPTAALDLEVANRLMALLTRLREETALTMVMITHRHDEAQNCASFIALLDGGRLIESGSRSSLLDGAFGSGPTHRFLAGSRSVSL